MHPKALLDAATELVRRVLQLEHPADAVVSRFFREQRALGPRERATLAETAYAVLRRKPLYEHLARSGTGGRERRLAILGFHAPRDFLKQALSEPEKAWLDACDAVPPAERKVAEPRWRIEHSQILRPEDIGRFAKLGVIASMQPSHAIGDLHFAPARLGESRLSGAYAWKSLLQSGAVIVGGSDAPVERGDPMIEFYAAVARKDLKGFSAPDWNAKEALSRTEALKLFTSAAAYGRFAEDDLGTIAPGKRADLSVFSVDLMTAPFADIPKAHAVMTVVGGRIVYDKR